MFLVKAKMQNFPFESVCAWYSIEMIFGHDAMLVQCTHVDNNEMLSYQYNGTSNLCLAEESFNVE